MNKLSKLELNFLTSFEIAYLKYINKDIDLMEFVHFTKPDINHKKLFLENDEKTLYKKYVSYWISLDAEVMQNKVGEKYFSDSDKIESHINEFKLFVDSLILNYD